MSVPHTVRFPDHLFDVACEHAREEGTPVDRFIQASVEDRVRRLKGGQAPAFPSSGPAVPVSNLFDEAFIAGLSHTIRTALASIFGFTEILEHEVTLTQQELVDIIQRGGRRLLRTIDTVEYLSQLQKGTFELTGERINVGEQLRKLLQPFCARADKKGLELQIDSPPETIYLDIAPEAFARIATALVDNAVKFTDQGHVTVRVRSQANMCLLTVIDTGTGIAPDEGEDIFKPFYQQRAVHGENIKGSGLGLTVVRRLIRVLGGDIDWQSALGDGTRFSVALPGCGHATTPNQKPDRKTDTWGVDQLPPQQQVLIVEDDPAICQLIPVMLPDSYRIKACRDATPALEEAKVNGYDIVLMDINLGDTIDGIELMRRMRDLEGYQDTLFIAVTAHGERHKGETFHEKGFDGYVAKPFSKKALYENLIQIR